MTSQSSGTKINCDGMSHLSVKFCAELLPVTLKLSRSNYGLLGSSIMCGNLFSIIRFANSVRVVAGVDMGSRRRIKGKYMTITSTRW